jgi:hypothetical protein
MVLTINSDCFHKWHEAVTNTHCLTYWALSSPNWMSVTWCNPLTWQCNSTQCLLDTRVVAVVLLGISGPLKHHLGDCWFHNKREVELAVECLWMKESDFCSSRICKLMPSWDKCIDVLRNYAEKLYISGITELHFCYDNSLFNLYGLGIVT